MSDLNEVNGSVHASASPAAARSLNAQRKRRPSSQAKQVLQAPAQSKATVNHGRCPLHGRVISRDLSHPAEKPSEFKRRLVTRAALEPARESSNQSTRVDLYQRFRGNRRPTSPAIERALVANKCCCMANDHVVHSQINGVNGEATNTDDLMKGKGKRAKAPAPRRPRTPYDVIDGIAEAIVGPKASARRPAASSSSAAKAVVPSNALSPTLNERVQRVSGDHFYFGSASDDGSTTISAGSTTNQLLLALPISLQKFMSFAKNIAILARQLPPIYKTQAYVDNSYQHQLRCVLELEGLMPTGVSGSVAAFVTTNLGRKVTPDNVLEIYKSVPSVHKIEVSGTKTARLTFDTGMMFLKKRESIVKPDASLMYAGYLVVFVTAPITSSFAVANNESNKPNRSYLGPIVTSKLTVDATFKGYEYAPTPAAEVAPGYTLMNSPIHSAPTPFLVGNASFLNGFCFMLNQNAVTPTLEVAAENAADSQANSGEALGSSGTPNNPRFDERTGSVITFVNIANPAQPSGYQLGIASTIGELASAFAGFSIIPKAIRAGLEIIFGNAIGDTIYDIGSDLIAWLQPTATSATTPNAPANWYWDSNGVCYYDRFGVDDWAMGYIKPASWAWNAAWSRLKVLYQTLGLTDIINAVDSVVASGQYPTIMMMPPSAMFTANTVSNTQPTPAYIGGAVQMGNWIDYNGGEVEAKVGWGQPDDPSALYQLPTLQRRSLIPVNGRRGPARSIVMHVAASVVSPGASGSWRFYMFDGVPVTGQSTPINGLVVTPTVYTTAQFRTMMQEQTDVGTSGPQAGDNGFHLKGHACLLANPTDATTGVYDTANPLRVISRVYKAEFVGFGTVQNSERVVFPKTRFSNTGNIQNAAIQVAYSGIAPATTWLFVVRLGVYDPPPGVTYTHPPLSSRFGVYSPFFDLTEQAEPPHGYKPLASKQCDERTYYCPHGERSELCMHNAHQA